MRKTSDLFFFILKKNKVDFMKIEKDKNLSI